MIYYHSTKHVFMYDSPLTLVIINVAAVLSKLCEPPPTVFTLSLQVLLHSALLSMSGFLDMPSKQGLLKELLPTHITPAKRTKHNLEVYL